jgi:hypothetical protein
VAQLSERARSEGIRRFTALVAADNPAMAGLLRKVRAHFVCHDPGALRYEIMLGPAERYRPAGAQFTRPADQRAAAIIPSQLDGLRRKERVRELYRQHLSVSGADGLAALAAVMAAEAGLDEHTALSWLTEFASAAQNE